MHLVKFTFFLTAIFFLSACGGKPKDVAAWDVEVILLEKGPAPTAKELAENPKMLVANHYRFVSGVPVEREGRALLIEDLLIFHPQAELPDVKVGEKTKLKINRWEDRPDLKKRPTKKTNVIADERPVFVVADA